MTKYRIIQGDCNDVLAKLPPGDTIFADPPDGINLGYDKFQDSWADDRTYAGWLAALTLSWIEHSPTVWVSYNAKHDVLYKHALVGAVLERYPEIEIKPFVQVFTFGQYRAEDCANNHRPLVRLRRPDAKLFPDAIKVPSWRELNGDKRAKKGGRVPGDVWDFPRVTGNSKQRREWHPTQLNELLVERAVKLTTPENGTVIDLFSGTGTTIRVCKRLGIACQAVELSGNYCRRIAKENNIGLWKFSKGRIIRGATNAS